MWQILSVTQRKSSKGFALPSVLFALLLIILLYSTVSKRLVTDTLLKGTEVTLAHIMADKSSLLTFAMMSDQNNHDGTELPITLNAGPSVFLLQDVSGLVDINAAHIDLIYMVLEGIGMPIDAANRAKQILMQFRSDGKRFTHETDITSVIDLPSQQAQKLTKLTTVYSGRTGIAPLESPAELLEAITGGTGTIFAMADLLPLAFVSTSSRTNFKVYAINENENRIYVGTIHKPQQIGARRILSY